MSDPVEIYVLDKTVRLLQPAGGFRTSLDSVMVAAACPAQDGDSVLDLGCGVGAVGLCLLHRVPGAQVTGIDIQAECVDLAVQNAGLNGSTAAFIQGDVRDFTAPERFNHVVCNPPFLEAGHYTPSPDAGRATALGHAPHPSIPLTLPSPHGGEGARADARAGEGGTTLKDWIDAAFRNLKSGGALTLIHRADALDKIILALGRRFGAVEVIPLWPRMGQAARRVIVRAVKDRKTPAVLHAGIVLHEDDGAYTPAADAILRGAAALL